ncbi:MAG: potassium-transporting ATPase subunit C, partial [Rhodospirillales bacterium]|nr:potassium-transporting ATPase subunit C [Rhodospirillales bacterium]
RPAAAQQQAGDDPQVIAPEVRRFQGAREQSPDPVRVRALVEQHISGRFLGLIGEPRVNVLALNRALDALPPG